VEAREPIVAFDSPGEYERFHKFIEDLAETGYLREIEPNENYERGLVHGGRRFKFADTGETWRLVAPDFPFRGLWEACT
jgi:hypothetical protein